MAKRPEQALAQRLNLLGWRFVEGVPYCPGHAFMLVMRGFPAQRWTAELVRIHLGCGDGFAPATCHWDDRRGGCPETYQEGR